MSFERLFNQLALEILTRILQRGSRSAFRATRNELEIIGRDFSALRHYHCPLHPVLKLTNISGPSMAPDGTQSVRSERQVSFIALHSELLQKFLREKLDILITV